MQIAPYSRTCNPTPIADMVRRLVAAGCSTEQIIIAIEGHELAIPVEFPVDEVAQRRREYDRERKRIKSNSGGIPPDSADVPLLVSKVTKKEKRRTSIPVEWNMAEDERSYALAKGLSEGETGAEAEKFKNHHMAKGDTMSDWKAAWRKWVGNALEYKGRAPVTAATRGLTPAEYHAKYTRKANGKADCEATANECAAEREDFQGQFLPSR